MPNATPKPIALAKGHRTKAEIELREEAEKSLMTGSSFSEWEEVKSNPTAHEQFTRLKGLYQSIGRDDGMIECVINRYCLILSECDGYQERQEKLFKSEEEIYENGSDLDFIEKAKLLIDVNKAIQANDKLLQMKRKMLLDIEKENLMTMVSAMRSIPKKPSEEEPSKMAKFIEGR